MSNPKSVPNYSATVAGLKQEFPVEKVKQRPGGGGKQLDYIPIETTLERLLEVAPQYTISYRDSEVYQPGGGSHWFARFTIELEIDGKTAVGTGAMVNADPDMATKSALSEAIKNAAKNGWGLALYLWDAEKLAEIAEERKNNPPMTGTALETLKVLVRQKALDAGWDGNGGKNAIAAALGVPVHKLDTEAGLNEILAA